jgi:hypothetical protein
LSRIIFLFLTTTLFTNFLAAQDFQIMVNGPWDYVIDPHREYDHNSQTPGDDRIVLVAPSTNHSAYIFSGPDATKTSNPIKPSSQNNPFLYYLDFPTPVQNGANGEPNEEPPQLYASKQTVSDQTIANVLYAYDSSARRYAVSLPMPDYIETYTGNYGTGFAESKIKVGKITNKTPPKEYTIWMVLHYSVKAMPKTMLLSYLEKGTSVKQDNPVPVTSAGGRSAISITLMDPTMTTDLECDPLSGYSFGASMKMWGLKEHARFPVQKDQYGTQYPGYFDYACPEAQQSALDVLKERLDEISVEKETTKKAIDDLRGDLAQLLDIKAAATKAHDKRLTGLQEDALKDLSNVHQDLDSLLGLLPQAVRDALSCTRNLIVDVNAKHDEPCPKDDSGSQLFDKYFGKSGVITLSAVGSTDCHKAQVDINNAFRDIAQ